MASASVSPSSAAEKLNSQMKKPPFVKEKALLYTVGEKCTQYLVRKTYLGKSTRKFNFQRASI
jgi:hypothetical protein